MKSIRCTVEIPAYSELKYEKDKKTGKLFIDRAITGSYPCNYGYINNTLWDDGDALDVFVVGDQIDTPLIEVNVEPFAVIELEDNGVSDTKIVGKVVGRKLWQKRTQYIDIILQFLQEYKEGIVLKSVSIREKDIEQAIQQGQLNRYKFPTKNDLLEFCVDL